MWYAIKHNISKFQGFFQLLSGIQRLSHLLCQNLIQTPIQYITPLFINPLRMLQPSIFHSQYMTIIQYFATSHSTYLGNCQCVTPQYILLTEGVLSGSRCSSFYINRPSPLYSLISMSLLKIVIHIVFKLTIICDPTEYIIPPHSLTSQQDT